MTGLAHARAKGNTAVVRRDNFGAAVGVVGMAVLGLLATACAGDDTTSPQATTPAAAPVAADRMELKVLAEVPPKIDALTAALRGGALAPAKAAYEAYDATWNGVEVYVNVRSKAMYDELEGNLQHQIDEGLGKPAPDYAALARVSDQLGTKFDEAIRTATDGQPLSPLFDDVTSLRIIRSDLRIANAALEAKDVAKAKQYFTTFKDNLEPATKLVEVRSAAAHQAIEDAVAVAAAEFSESDVTPAKLDPLMATVTAHYNFGLALWNAAARNADPAKSAHSTADLDNAKVLGSVAEEISTSLKAWQGKDYATATKESDEATENFAKVQPALAKRNEADIALKEALAAYAKVAGKAGDGTKISGLATKAVEAALVGQQVLVGQFWTTPAVQSELGAAPDDAAPAGSCKDKVSANIATEAELAAAFESAGIKNAARWAHEVEEYRPYPADPAWAKLRKELTKYNASPEVLDAIINCLE